MNPFKEIGVYADSNTRTTLYYIQIILLWFVHSFTAFKICILKLELLNKKQIFVTCNYNKNGSYAYFTNKNNEIYTVVQKTMLYSQMFVFSTLVYTTSN